MIVHIVPTVPPIPNGLGDYCYKLWEHWPVPKPDWHCLTVQVPENGPELWPQVGISSFTLSRPGLVRALEEVGATSVVLHYVGYGYQPKGCPVWLPPALREWKKKRKGRVTVMFHELYFRGKPRQSSFWLSPISRKIMVDLVQVADRWITSCSEYQDRLVTEGKASLPQGALIPVGPNITPIREVDFFRPWPVAKGGKLKIVIFGLPNTRLWALQPHQSLLKSLCEQDLVESILLLGKSDEHGEIEKKTEEIVRQIGFTDKWHHQYDLSAAQLSEAFQGQDVGLIANWPGTLTKSTAYAAFTAHGIISVGVRQTEVEDDTFPALTSNDAWHRSCIAQLQNTELIQGLKHRLHKVAAEQLGWKVIAQNWANIINERC